MSSVTAHHLSSKCYLKYLFTTKYNSFFYCSVFKLFFSKLELPVTFIRVTQNFLAYWRLKKLLFLRTRTQHPKLNFVASTEGQALGMYVTVKSIRWNTTYTSLIEKNMSDFCYLTFVQKIQTIKNRNVKRS
jgi:hypothetical protein